MITEENNSEAPLVDLVSPVDLIPPVDSVPPVYPYLPLDSVSLVHLVLPFDKNSPDFKHKKVLSELKVAELELPEVDRRRVEHLVSEFFDAFA